MTLARKLRAPSSRPRLGPAEDQLPILEREEEAEGEGKEQAPPEEVGKEPQVLQALERGQARVSQKVALGQDGAQLPSSPPEPERKSKRRKRKLKKYGKNVGKALQKGCRYLVLGLQGLANAYSSPLGVAVSVATAFR